jgi:hypothetical protein
VWVNENSVFTYLDFTTISFLESRVISLVSSPQAGGPGLCIYVPKWQGGLVIPSGTRFLLSLLLWLRATCENILTCPHMGLIFYNMINLHHHNHTNYHEHPGLSSRPVIIIGIVFLPYFYKTFLASSTLLVCIDWRNLWIWFSVIPSKCSRIVSPPPNSVLLVYWYLVFFKPVQ